MIEYPKPGTRIEWQFFSTTQKHLLSKSHDPTNLQTSGVVVAFLVIVVVVVGVVGVAVRIGSRVVVDASKARVTVVTACVVVVVVVVDAAVVVDPPFAVGAHFAAASSQKLPFRSPNCLTLKGLLTACEILNLKNPGYPELADENLSLHSTLAPDRPSTRHTWSVTSGVAQKLNITSSKAPP
uniref:Uncharacterized protein n=1 Tax=Romanomermis culicivorax TaxID=13658 RepID=A0A915KGQ4_ROMCU